MPLLLVEVAGGADASPGEVPVSFAAALADELPTDRTSADLPARSVGSLTGEELAAPRLFSVFTQGDALRAQAAAEAEAAEVALEAEAERQRQAELEAAERARVQEEAEAREAARRQAEAERQAQAAREAAAAAPPAPTSSVGMPAGTTANQWHRLRMCESSNNYGAVNPAGPYLGAYQFLQSTWDGTARSVGRTDLVGVAPNQAAPADQDAMAYALYNRSGAGPWPHCGAHLY
ncbi:MAG: transglycosylase family protein [Acidimicrobiales bacterium]